MAKHDRLDKAIAYKDLFASPAGKIVLEDLEKFCFKDAPTFVVGDQYWTAHNEGRRLVILHIHEYLSRNLDHFRNNLPEELND